MSHRRRVRLAWVSRLGLMFHLTAHTLPLLAPSPLNTPLARAEEFVPWPILKQRLKALKELKARYKQSAGQERADLLVELAKLNPQEARPLVEAALTQREDPIARGGGLRAAAFYQDRALRDLALNALTSAYVLERQQLVGTLVAWGGEAGLLGLKELALDKSVSVRQAALEALGAFGGAEDLLKSYAIDGPDEGTAESAARAWLRAAGGPGVERGEGRAGAVAIELLSSSYEEARAVGSEALVSGGAASCAPLVRALLNGVGHEASVEGALRALWGACEGELFDEALRSDDEARARLFGALQRWGDRGERAREFAKSVLSTSQAEALRAAAAQAQVSLAPAERLLVLRPLLTAESELERCAALRALCAPTLDEEGRARPVEGEARAVCLERARAEIRPHLPTPARAREALLCALEVVSRLKSGDLDELLTEAYAAWSSSIAYGDLRLALTRAAAASPAPTRLSTLMEAMLDTDPRVKAEAERALRAR